MPTRFISLVLMMMMMMIDDDEYYGDDGSDNVKNHAHLFNLETVFQTEDRILPHPPRLPTRPTPIPLKNWVAQSVNVSVHDRHD